MSRKPTSAGWLERTGTVNGIVYTLWALCALLIAAEFFYHKHPHFGFDGWFGFYALAGFGAYCVIVFSAKGLRRLIARNEDYYGEDDDG